jgi:cephalosporin hydroxylase
MSDETSAALALLNDLAERYYAPGDATRKGESYMRAYARLLGARRREELRLLELGISSGASLLIWREFLPNATIVGVDIADAPDRVKGQDRIHTLVGSQDDPAVLDRAAAAAGGPFDLIIDDASHIGYLTKRSLLYLFPRWLKPGGCYVIEDFGTGFIPAYPDGVVYQEMRWDDAVEGTTLFASSQSGMVGLVKQLVEPMMQGLMTGSQPFLQIQRLTIETNIAFIEKATGPSPVPPTLPEAGAAPVRDELMATLRSHEERLGRLEAQIEVLRRTLGPAWRLWRRVLGG